MGIVLGSVIAAFFIIVIAVVAGMLKAAFLGGLLTALMGFLVFVSPEDMDSHLSKLHCDAVTGSALSLMASDSYSAIAIKKVLSGKLPTVSFYDSGTPVVLMEGVLQETQVLFVDLNKVPEDAVISNAGPVVAYASDPTSLLPDHSISIASQTLVSLCQKELSDGAIQVKSPLIVLDHEGEEQFIQSGDGTVDFPWGAVLLSEDVGVYTFGQVKDVIREVMINKKVDSLVSIRPGFTFTAEPVQTISEGIASDSPIESEFDVNETSTKDDESGGKFEAQYTRECSILRGCEISVNEEQMNKTVSSLFASKGGSFTKKFTKKLVGFGEAEFVVVATNPVVEFVEVGGLEKIQTTIDLDISTNNNLIQNKLLEGQTIRAIVQSSLIYDDNTWRFYSHEPKVVDILFSKPSMLILSLRKPLTGIVNLVAGEVLKKVPVFDLDKSSIIGTDAAGYLLDSVEIVNKSLVVKLSVF